MARLPIVGQDDGEWGEILNEFLEVSLDNVHVNESQRGKLKPSAVDDAGAVMNTDSSTAAMQFVVDEDDMASNTATKLPTQQSVKAYVDNASSSKANDAEVVKLTGNQTIGGQKTFSDHTTHNADIRASYGSDGAVTISGDGGGRIFVWGDTADTAPDIGIASQYGAGAIAFGQDGNGPDVGIMRAGVAHLDLFDISEDADVRLSSVANPTDDQDAATKSYVDSSLTHSIASSSMGLRTSGLDGWFSALSNVRTNPVDIVIIGDSISVLGAETSFPMLLLKYFSTLGGTNPEGGQYIHARGVPSATSTMNAEGVDSTTGIGGYAALQTNGQIARYTRKFDAVTIFYTRKPDGGSIEVRVGGAGGTLLTTIDTSGTQKSSQYWTSAALTFQNQELHLTAVCDGGETVLLEGVYFHAGTRDRGVRVYPAGHSGWQSSHFTSDPSTALDLIETIQPDVVIVATGTNDGSESDPTEYQTEITALINAIKARTSNDIALWIPYINNVFSAAEAELGRQVASDLGVALIDGARNIGDFSSVGDPGKTYSSDNVHPGNEMRRMIAYNILGILSGDPIGKLYDASAKAMTRLELMESTQSWTQASGGVRIDSLFGFPTFALNTNTHDFFTVNHPSINAALGGYNSSSIGLGDGASLVDTIIWRETAGQISINRGSGAVRAIRPIKSNTDVDYILEREDQSITIESNNSLEQTITIPTNTAVPFPVGSVIYVTQHGTGQVTLSPDTGVTLNAQDDNLSTTGQHTGLMLHKRATDEWTVFHLSSSGGSGSAEDISFDNTVLGAYGIGGGENVQSAIDGVLYGMGAEIDKRTPRPGIITEATTSRTLATADAWDYIRLTNATSCDITVPDNADDPIPVGTHIYLRSSGTGIYTIVEDTAVTVHPPSGGTLVLAGDAALIKVATDEWDLVGATVAV